MKTVRVAAGLFVMGTLCAPTGASAQDDKFAQCPDPAAAKRYVQQCLGQNPYNTREVCEERALEELCSGKK